MTAKAFEIQVQDDHAADSPTLWAFDLAIFCEFDGLVRDLGVFPLR